MAKKVTFYLLTAICAFVFTASMLYAWQITDDRRDSYSVKAVDIRCNNGAEHTVIYSPETSPSKPYCTGIITICQYTTLSEAAEYLCGE